MRTHAQRSREADLYLARQFGQLFVRQPNPEQIRIDFKRIFPDDREAQEQFDLGVIEEDQKRLALGLSPEQFHSRHARWEKTHA